MLQWDTETLIGHLSMAAVAYATADTIPRVEFSLRFARCNSSSPAWSSAVVLLPAEITCGINVSIAVVTVLPHMTTLRGNWVFLQGAGQSLGHYRHGGVRPPRAPVKCATLVARSGRDPRVKQGLDAR